MPVSQKHRAEAYGQDIQKPFSQAHFAHVEDGADSLLEFALPSAEGNQSVWQFSFREHVPASRKRRAEASEQGSDIQERVFSAHMMQMKM